MRERIHSDDARPKYVSMQIVSRIFCITFFLFFLFILLIYFILIFGLALKSVTPERWKHVLVKAVEYGCPLTSQRLVDVAISQHGTSVVTGNLATRWWAVFQLKQEKRFRSEEWAEFNLPLGGFSGTFDTVFSSLTLDGCGGFVPHHLGFISRGLVPDPDTFGAKE